MRSVSGSHPELVRLVRLRRRAGRLRARSLAVDHYVISDVVVMVDAGVVCMTGWLSALLEAVTDGQSALVVPHYDHLTHPASPQYVETHLDLVAALSWSLTIRMRRLDFR